MAMVDRMEAEDSRIGKIDRTRSPSYPRIALERAIELTRRVYGAAHTATVDTNTFLELMGFAGNTGPARSALASLKQFGLVDGRDQSVKVTPLALSILQPMDESEKSAAVRAAFAAPPL